MGLNLYSIIILVPPPTSFPLANNRAHTLVRSFRLVTRFRPNPATLILIH
jgi:hypothetical protein